MRLLDVGKKKREKDKTEKDRKKERERDRKEGKMVWFCNVRKYVRTRFRETYQKFVICLITKS